MVFFILRFLLFFLSLTPSSSYSLTGNTLKDLESNQVDLFQQDADSWTSSTPISPGAKISLCYDNYLLGGPNVLDAYGYFQRYYTGLPSHNMIRVSFQGQKIDSWEAGENFLVQFDSLPVLSGWTLDTFSSTYGSHLCGGMISNSFQDSPLITVVIEVPHIASDLTFTVTSNLNQDSLDESFGFRNITMKFYTLITPLTSQTFCGISQYPLPDRWCSCLASNYYMSPANSGSCYPCHTTCQTCSAASQYSCLSCYPGYYQSGTQCLLCDSSCKTCNGPSQYDCLSCHTENYLTDLKNCVTSCPMPLDNTADINTEYCSTPCVSTDYLAPDRNCYPDCNSPMKQQLVDNYFLLCIFPCKPHEYAFYNETCGEYCPSPLSKVTSYNRLFCLYPCNSTQFLYWDGSCGNSCNFPVDSYTEGTGSWQRQFCAYPCALNEYLYWNRSCLTTCPSPLKVRISRSRFFCDFPCSSSQYTYWDGSCSSICQTTTKPLIQIIEGTPTRRFCYFPCEIDEFLYWNGTCSKICIPPLASTYENSRSFCNYPCTSAQSLNWDGACITSCNPPYLLRIEAGLKYCDYQCAPPTPYLYWNGSCLATCPSPLQITTKGPAFFCNFPCSSSTDFLYWNGTCAPQCDNLLSQRIEGTPSRKFCDFSCSSDDNFLYWNNTCKSECPQPLVFIAIAGKKYCDYPCSTASGAGTPSASQFLYWNSSCLSTCASPLQIKADGVVTYCLSPCPANQYLNWDGTCSTQCLPPLKPQTEVTTQYPYIFNFCRTGCTSSQYLYWDGSCQNTCDPPLKSKLYSGAGNTQPFCYQPCSNTADSYYPNLKACRPSCLAPYYVNNTNTPYLSCIKISQTQDGWFIRHFLTAPETQGETSIIRVVKLMEHMRYLDIKMAPRLERLIMSKGRNILSFNFGWDMSEEMQVFFSNHQDIPEIFKKHGLVASFLTNFWKDFTMIALIIFLAVIFVVLENITKMWDFPFTKGLFERLRAVFKWNFLIVFFAMCMDDVILYSSLQFRSLSAPNTSFYDYIYIAFSLLGTLAILALSVGFLYAAFFFLYLKRSRSHLEPNVLFKNSGFLKKYQDYQVIFQGYNPASLSTQSFYLAYIIRACYLPMIIAAYMYPYPFPQVILQVIISFTILGYLIFARPLESKISYVQLLISESLVLMMNVCLLVLKCLEMGGIESDTTGAVLLGDIIIGGNVLFNGAWIIFLLIKLINEAREIYKHIKGQEVKERGIWVELLVVWMQQGGMGFEEVKIRETIDIPDEESWEENPENKEDLLGEKEEMNGTKNISIENADLEKEPDDDGDKNKRDSIYSRTTGISLRSFQAKSGRKTVRFIHGGINLKELREDNENDNRLETRVNLGRSNNELPIGF